VLLSHQSKRKKKGCLVTPLWMSIWDCCSPSSYCQPSASAGFVYLEFPACMSLLFAPVYSPKSHLQLQSFLSEEWPSPHSGGAFHMTAAVTSFPLHKLAGQVQLLFPSLASLFIYISPEGFTLPHSLGLQESWPHCYMLLFFIQLLVYYSVCFFLLFPHGWGSVCPGGYGDLAQGCLWE
jgi:hypothetical protein